MAMITTIVAEYGDVAVLIVVGILFVGVWEAANRRPDVTLAGKQFLLLGAIVFWSAAATIALVSALGRCLPSSQ